MISTKTHGLIDYMAGIFLSLAPYLFGFATGGVAQWISEGVGLAVIMVSLMTNYELGAVKLIPIKIHFILDMVVGLVLLAALVALHFDHTVMIPFLLIGIAGFAVPAMTTRS